MIVSIEDFAFLKRLQLEVVAQFEDSLCFAHDSKYNGFAFLKKVQSKTVSEFSHPNPNLETTKICS